MPSYEDSPSYQIGSLAIIHIPKTIQAFESFPTVGTKNISLCCNNSWQMLRCYTVAKMVQQFPTFCYVGAQEFQITQITGKNHWRRKDLFLTDTFSVWSPKVFQVSVVCFWGFPPKEHLRSPPSLHLLAVTARDTWNCQLLLNFYHCWFKIIRDIHWILLCLRSQEGKYTHVKKI